ALAHQCGVARSRLCFRLFAPLLLCPESVEALSLGFLTPALRFRLGCGFGLALLLCLHGGQALLFSLLSLCPRFRLGRGVRLALLLCLRGRSFSASSRVPGCPAQGGDPAMPVANSPIPPRSSSAAATPAATRHRPTLTGLSPSASPIFSISASASRPKWVWRKSMA